MRWESLLLIQFLQSLMDPFHDLFDSGKIQGIYKEKEFVSSIPTRFIVDSNRSFQNGSELFQYDVSLDMTIGIVYHLEIIDIDLDDRVSLLFSEIVQKHFLQTYFTISPIEYQRIIEGLMLVYAEVYRRMGGVEKIHNAFE